MALFQFRCPQCSRPTLLGPKGQCVNLLNDQTTCGYQLPLQYDDGNSMLKSKFNKHTNPPPDTATSDWSWRSDSDDYESHRLHVMEHGCVQLNTKCNHLFLWSTPNGASTIASLFYSDAGTVAGASGVYMPLNSKLQNLHHFYSNHKPEFVHISDGPNLTIERPNERHPSEYCVIQGSSLIFSFDPDTQKREWHK